MRRALAALAAALLWIGLGGPAGAQQGRFDTTRSVIAALFPSVTLCDPVTSGNCAQVNSSGQLLTSGGGGATFPYTLVTQGQTATAASGVGVLGVYNTSAPSLTNGQAAPLQLNSAGALYTAITGTPTFNCGTGCSGSAYNGLTYQAPTVLTSSSATTCTAISTSKSLVIYVNNVNVAAQTVTLTLFNDNATCAAGDAIWIGVMPAGQVVQFGQGMYASAGLSYTLSGAAASNISIGYAK